MKQLQQSLSKFLVSVKLHSVTVCVIVYSHIGDTDQFCVGLCSLLHINFDYIIIKSCLLLQFSRQRLNKLKATVLWLVLNC